MNIKGVTFILYLSMPALSNRKKAFVGTTRDRRPAQGHNESDVLYMTVHIMTTSLDIISLRSG